MLKPDRILAPKMAKNRPGSKIALAIALMCGTALGIGALEAPAHAAKKKRDSKKDKAPKANYSKEFIAAYKPVHELMKKEAPDVVAAKAEIPAVLAVVSTPDDKMVAGGLLYNIGLKTEDVSLQRQGLDMIIDSGKAKPEDLGKFMYSAGQLAYVQKDYDTARARFLEASATGYDVANLDNIISSLYFQQDRYAEGIAYLKGKIDEAVSKGNNPSEELIKRAFSAAYNNDLKQDALDLTVANVQYYPTDANWINVIALRREYYDENSKILLDLLRLQDRTAGLKNERDYVNYIETTTLRFPIEIKRVVDQGVAAGILDSKNVFVQEAMQGIGKRVSGVREDLAGLEADARAAGAGAIDATAAGDVFLSAGKPAKAEDMYKIAVSKPGVDADMAYTRLGIAQVDQDKIADAKASFAKVSGDYKNVADLWSVYAEQKAKPAPAATTTSAPAM